MKYDWVLWDFNGTILDDVYTGLRCINALLSRRSLPVLADTAAYRRVFGFPVSEYYERVGLDLVKESFDDLAVEWVKEYKATVKGAGVFPGVREAMNTLHDAGIRQAVLSATQRDQLREQLVPLNLPDCLEDAIGMDTIHAASKITLARDWRAAHPDARVVMLGDTIHDAEVAEAGGMDCILVSCGHQDEQRLREAGVPVAADVQAALALILE